MINTQAITDNQREAVKILKMYCGGEFNDFWTLAGGSKGSCRKHILEVLTGEKWTIAMSGVNTLQNKFYDSFGITGSCMADYRDNFSNLIRGI